jgi:hypothetical protein
MGVGSYALSLGARARSNSGDPQVLAGKVLKAVGQHPNIPLGALISETASSELEVLAAVEMCLKDELIEATPNGGYQLTVVRREDPINRSSLTHGGSERLWGERVFARRR